MNSKLLAAGLTLSIAAVSGWMTYELLTAQTNRVQGRFGCEMHCEPGKTYGSTKQPCAVCGMTLRPVADLPYALGVSTDPLPPEVGLRMRLVVRALDQTAMPIRTLRSLDHAAGRQIRTVIVPEDFSTLHVDSPARSSDGTFTTTLTHDRPGKYTLWAEFDPAAAGGPVYAQWSYLVDPSGPHTDDTRPIPAISTGQLTDTTDQVLTLDQQTIRIRCNGPKARAGNQTLIRVAVDPAAPGATPDRLIAIAADGRGMVSAAPLRAEAPEHAAALARAAEYGNGQQSDALFRVRYPAAGFYRVYLLWNSGDPSMPPAHAGFWQQVERNATDDDTPPTGQTTGQTTGHEHHAPGHPAAEVKGQGH